MVDRPLRCWAARSCPTTDDRAHRLPAVGKCSNLDPTAFAGLIGYDSTSRYRRRSLVDNPTSDLASSRCRQASFDSKRDRVAPDKVGSAPAFPLTISRHPSGGEYMPKSENLTATACAEEDVGPPEELRGGSGRPVASIIVPMPAVIGDEGVDLNPDPEDDAVGAALVEILGILKGALEREPPGRRNYVVALAAIAQFVRPFIGLKPTTRLLDLAAALSDLDQGSQPALLTPVKVSNRRADSSKVWSCRAWAALALECLVRCGADLEIAAEELSRHAPFERKKLKSWRSELIADRVKNILAQTTWGNGLTQIKGLG
jgi:hypothetical protein